MATEKITLENKDGIYYIGFGKNEEKSLTVISEQTLLELDNSLDEISQDKKAKGLVLYSHKPNCFLAGMDVSVIQSLNSEVEAAEGCEKGQSVFNKIEDLRVPSIALVDGVCLGGGLEMALACNKIICSDNPKTALGLPEVMLGVLPGFGGTYRLPRKIGLTSSLDLLLSGKQLKAKKAKKCGLVVEVMPSERLLEKAQEISKTGNWEENHLTGSIPDNIGSMINLKVLLLNDNRLTGEIPPNIINLTNLDLLYIHTNKLSGIIPDNFCNLCSAPGVLIRLEYNNFCPDPLTQLYPTCNGNLNAGYQTCNAP